MGQEEDAESDGTGGTSPAWAQPGLQVARPQCPATVLKGWPRCSPKNQTEKASKELGNRE